MSLNCWEGCIARVTQSNTWVLCLERAPVEEAMLGIPVWKVELLNSTKLGPNLTGTIRGSVAHPGYIARARDRDLRPIPPDELRDATPTEESLPCHAL